MISQAQDILNVATSAAFSAGMFGFGLRGTPRRGPSARRRRQVRWPSLTGGVLGAGMAGYVAFYSNFTTIDLGIGTIGSVIAILVALAIALFAIRLGLRGRRVGDHPYCRRCGFDLFGKPDTSTVCTECGTDLSTPRAVVVGTHERRMIPLMAGLFTLVLALALTIPIGRDVWNWSQRKDWSPWKPESWLVARLRDGTATYQDGNEVWRRIAARTLSAEALASILDNDIKAGAATRPAGWLSSGIDQAMSFMEPAWQSGLLDEPRARRVLQAALDCRLNVAPRAAQGEVLRYAVLCSEESLASNFRYTKLTIGPPHVTIAGNAIQSFVPEWAPLFNSKTGEELRVAGNRIPLKDLGEKLPFGPAAVEIRLTITATLAVQGRPTLVESRDLVLTGSTTIVTRDAMTCPPLTVPQLKSDGTIDESLPPVIATLPSLPKDGHAKTEYLPRITYQPDRDGERPVFRIREATTNALRSDAFFGDLSIRTSNGIETPLGRVLIDDWQAENPPLTIDLPPEPFDIILRPTPERGCELFDPVPIYYSTVVIPSSAIER